MDPERQEDVIDKQLVHLVGMAERRQYRAPETGNRGVVDSHGFMVQVANSRYVGLVCDRIQRATRQIKKQVVVRLVEKSYGIAFQVMEINLASAQVTHRHLPSVLPILAIGKIAQRQSDEKCIFPLDRVAQSEHRVIASGLRDGHVGGAQYPRNNCVRLLGSQPLSKPLPITFTDRHDRPPARRRIEPAMPPCRSKIYCTSRPRTIRQRSKFRQEAIKSDNVRNPAQNRIGDVRDLSHGFVWLILICSG